MPRLSFPQEIDMEFKINQVVWVGLPAKNETMCTEQAELKTQKDPL